MGIKHRELIAFIDLEKKIVNPGFCTLCGACEAACPVHAIKVNKDKLRYIHDCSKELDLCPICYNVCPHSDMLLLEAAGFLMDAPNRREGLGYYRRILMAQAADPKLREISHSGGVVTALLTYALDKNIIDGAVVSESEPQAPMKLKSLVGLVSDDLLSAVDSKLSPSAVAKAFGSAVHEYGKARVAFVGVPHEILAIRKLEAWEHKIMQSLKITIGLFCLWFFSLDSLLKYLKEEFNIKTSNIKKINLTSKYQVHTAQRVLEIPLSEIKPHVLSMCQTCMDFTSELADISVGGAHPIKDWSIVILRSKTGEDLFDEAVNDGVIRTMEVEQKQDVFAHLVEMAMHKKESALKEVEKRRRTNSPIPPITERLTRFLPKETAFLASIKIKDVMTTEVTSVTADITVDKLLDIMTRLHHMGYPVVDQRNELIGIVTFEDITKVPRSKRDKVLVGEIVHRALIVAHPEETLQDALKKMKEHQVGRIVVVEPTNRKKLCGILTKTDIMHALTFWFSL